MPDQYTFAAFQRNVLTPGHKPVMAEIDTDLFAHSLGPAADHGALEQGRQRLGI